MVGFMTGRRKRNGVHHGTLFSGVLWLGVVALFAGAFFAPRFSSSRRSGGEWTEVPCRIESSSVERRGADDFAFTAEYAFYWNGHMHRSVWLDRTGNREHSFSRLENRLPLLEKYAPGTQHVCLVEPGSDANAVLFVQSPLDEPSKSGGVGWMLVGSFFLLVVLAGVWQIVDAFPKTRRLWDGRLKKAIPALCLALFGVPFATGGAEMLPEALSTLKLAREELVSVPGKVLYSGVARQSVHHKGHHSTVYSVCVGYEYVFQGKKYESDSFNGPAGDFSTSDRRAVRQRAADYSPGNSVEVWVLPSNPRYSALRPVGPTMGYGILGGSVLFLLVGLAASGTGVFLLVRIWRAKRTGQPGSWTLRPSHANTFFLGIFAAFWNLLAWSGALVFAADPGPRDPLMLLVWTFPLIGLGVAAAFAVSLWRDRQAPALAMTLSLPDGVTPVLDWRLEEPSGVRSLSILLEGFVPGSKYQRTVVVVSIPVCKHAAPVPGSWSERFRFPYDDCGAEKWRLAVRLETAGERRPFRLEYGIPEEAVPEGAPWSP